MLTKRKVFSDNARLYDSLGLVTPVTISAKPVLQKLWEKKYGWDQQLPEEIETEWNEIMQNFEVATTVANIPRQIITNSEGKKFIHVFSDASTIAYSVVIYVQDGEQVNLLLSKTRVAPAKKRTVPELELMGMHLAVVL